MYLWLGIQLKLLFTIVVVRVRLLFMTKISYTDDSVQNSLCGEWLPADQRPPDFARTELFTCKCTWVWDNSRVYMYLVLSLCKLGTTFCVNFEQQRCKILVYTAASCNCSMPSSELEGKKSVDFAWACLSDPHFTNHLPFKTNFCCTKGWS